MNVSHVRGAAAAQAVAEPRVILVHQSFFPGPSGVHPDGPHMTVLGSGWAAEPKSVSVYGKTYPVSHIASRGRGAPINEYRVMMPTLPSGDNLALVKLANGVSVPVILRVESAY